jgi:hypothetical protein
MSLTPVELAAGSALVVKQSAVRPHFDFRKNRPKRQVSPHPSGLFPVPEFPFETGNNAPRFTRHCDPMSRRKHGRGVKARNFSSLRKFVSQSSEEEDPDSYRGLRTLCVSINSSGSFPSNLPTHLSKACGEVAPSFQ